MPSQPIAGRVLLQAALVTMETPREFVNRTYEAERAVVFRYLLSLGLDRESALDLTQDTFVRLYRAVARGHEIRVARGWLLTTASRLAFDHRRTEGELPRVAPEDAEFFLSLMPDGASDPEAAALQRERREVLSRAFHGLSRQQKVCVHLRAEGLRYREIAESLGVSVSTVSEFMRRAVARLRSAMNG